MGDGARLSRAHKAGHEALVYAEQICKFNFIFSLSFFLRISMVRQNLTNDAEQGDIVFATELARRYGSEGVVSICVNPGNLRSDLQRHQSAFQHWVTVRVYVHVSTTNPTILTLRLFITVPNSLSLQHNVFSFPVEYGALTQLWGGTMPETIGYNGKYLIAG